MGRFALIEDGRIQNIALAEADWAAAAPGAWVAAEPDWRIGALWDAALGAPARSGPSRAELASAITAEQERRLLAATLEIDAGAGQTLTQPLDRRTLDYLRDFNRIWTEGRAAASYRIMTDQAAATLSAGQVRQVALATDAYVAALPAASAARHQALSATLDADLTGFDPADDAAWPSLRVAVSLAGAPTPPAAALDDRLAALEARLQMLEATP